MHANGFQGSLYTAAGRRKYVTADERNRFLAASLSCPRGGQRTLCLVLAYTGCRISEALRLIVYGIQRQGGFIAFRTLKKRDRVFVREVPVPDVLFDELEQVHGIADADPATRLWPLSRTRAWHLVKQVMEAADIKGGPHATAKGLRHGFGIHAIGSGVPINLVQRWLGHSSMTTTAIYLDAVGAEEREIAARMWRV